ncbi:DDE-type integrase/transposase/recombinase (plasmid) [Lichenicola cladoniae]|uniref:DDE-type integrase/transposase/recombinase n=1 Tax=Lichenicola cladoniae TaxID=1484109 RepID=A0A6M8HYP7_9PROT|nr:DDE-type integrase/transposase/recombinase [Lichenicola cladoniae]NPD69581.1 DDE-type integrase/transposase/recombinase [Acetobacteraceae bacterium]QKE93460.1 DDE-type integrase/transposase/recombinase [Lichenicola cladoniae]
MRGRWAYLYRAIDREGNLIDAMLRQHRDMMAAKALFRFARATMGFRPDRVTTDGHGS